MKTLELTSEEKGLVARLRSELADLHTPEELAGIGLRSLVLWLTYLHRNHTNADSMRPYIAGARTTLDNIERLALSPAPKSRTQTTTNNVKNQSGIRGAAAGFFLFLVAAAAFFGLVFYFFGGESRGTVATDECREHIYLSDGEYEWQRIFHRFTCERPAEHGDRSVSPSDKSCERIEVSHGLCRKAFHYATWWE